MNRPINAQLQQSIEQLPESLQLSARRAWDKICEHDGAQDCLQKWSAEVCDVFSRLLANSEYAAATSCKHWSWLQEAVTSGRFDQPPKTGFTLAAINRVDELAVKHSLREYRHRQMLHILWREYAHSASLGETLTSLSELADELLVASRAVAVEMLSDRYGEITDAAGRKISLVILAMGKLGGFELNLSSDIDIIFLYPEEGETSGPRKLSAYQYFTRVARRIVKLLADVTEDGFVYRVDTRLRPFGDSGPPVTSFASLESYLLQHGRSWERYAYVKARIVGEARSGRVVTDLMRNLIEPFVYRRYLDFGVFESLRDMHTLIAAEVQRRELASNIKRGPGGIREIEFIVQSLQLVRGGANDNLRRCEFEAALQELHRSRSLAADVTEELRNAYRFLRRLENFMQAIRDQQTHDLPENDLDRARLAFAMQFGSWGELAVAASGHRQTVSERFREVAFREDGVVHDLSNNSYSALWEAAADESRWSGLFNAEGFRNPEPMARELVAFSRRVQALQIDTSARKRLRQMLPELLNLLHRRQSPEIILRRVLNIVDKILRRSAYIALLNENLTAMHRLVDLCEHSAYLAEEIGRYPILLDEMLDPRLFTSTVSAGEMRADIAERLQQVAGSDSERMVEVLGHYQRAALFRIAIADFSGNLPIMKVSDALTELAESILTRLLDIAWQDLVRKYGAPWFVVDGVRRRAGFGVVAYGKLGGMELSYGSDLDLVFLHDSAGSDQQTDGAKSLDNSVFFARLVRRLVHFLTIQTASGALYEVDTRLRPSGRAGLLVINVEAFERYQIDNAWTWEHQALLRSRPVAGDVSVHREFERVRTETLQRRVDQQKLADDVRSMRARMRQQLDKSTPDLFDLKQAPGGIADLEFLVQYLALKNASRDKTVIHYRDNIRQLGTLAAAGCLAQWEVHQLQETYRKYRARLHRLALDSRPPLVGESEFAEERQRVIGLWQREVGVNL